MSVKLNNASFEFGKRLVREGHCAIDDRDAWSEHEPTAAEEDAFIEQHGWTEFGHWHLAVDSEARPETKEHYKFPYGDFKKVHRCGLLAAETRAGQRKYDDVEAAAIKLLEMLEKRTSDKR